jgi:enamine deaminase RidA (YjgF/YER057c/UK114 family)
MLVKRLSPDTMHKNPAYSQVAVVPPQATLVYVGGQNGVDASGQVVSPEIGPQAKQAMQNVVAALAAAGASVNDVFKWTIYLVQGQSLRDAFAAAQPFFPRDVPPGTVTGLFVAALANPAYLIEIEAVAAI